MKVNISLEFDETLRRRVRASYGRGGMATRSEIRTWVDRQLGIGRESLPEPKTRPCNTARRKALERETAAAVAPIAPDVLCGNCGKVKAEHLGMLGKLCPIGKHVKPGSMFRKVATA